MNNQKLLSIAPYCDRLLKVSQFTDWPGAVNGLQVENNGNVTKIAAAVDATLATVKMAVEAGADLLLVHHGLFWSPTHPWVGKKYELIQQLVNNNLAVYSSHLPLDAHPRFGNNVLLARALGLKNFQPFFQEKGQPLGVQAIAKLAREDLADRLGEVLGAEPIMIPGGPTVCKKIGIVTGGAGEQLKTAAAEGVDTFITGEGKHWTYALAEELGINVFYGGHYATETFGVKALAQHLALKFRVEWAFLDHPTGL
ncbi:MAG: Nif3-like dinuclear metal center hexameric protein [Verrucomicrobiales bacterium]